MQNSETKNGVRVEIQEPIVTIILDRPGVRNAVDGVTAQALADAFRAFEADPALRVAVLFGDNGVFCAGADLSAVASKDVNRSNRISPTGMEPILLTLLSPQILINDRGCANGCLSHVPFQTSYRSCSRCFLSWISHPAPVVDHFTCNRFCSCGRP